MKMSQQQDLKNLIEIPYPKPLSMYVQLKMQKNIENCRMQ